MGIIWLAFGAVGAGFLFMLLSGLWSTRCPVCGRFFGAKEDSRTETASVTTEEQIYDQESSSFKTVTRTQRGYLVGYSCRFCRHSWERLDATSRIT